MRRMRDQNRQMLLFGISVVVIGLSFGYYIKKRREYSKVASTIRREIASALPIRKSLSEKNLETTPSVPKATGECTAIEFPGKGAREIQVRSEDWKKVMTTFHESKRLLIHWLSVHHEGIPGPSVALMIKKIANLKIVAPPSLEEPDLLWRGIGVWSKNQDSGELIRLGNGFIQLVLQNPIRAQFELTRLLAQSWSPCELHAVAAKGPSFQSPWTGILECLNIEEEESCNEGNYSEAGWAVSSVLAAHLSPPGCTLPALTRSEESQCIHKALLEEGRSQ